uniref:Uncharacterized protein n=1 Tax=Arundo donax TaxID=35708 RepID=A0A0A9CEY0_ARUDO
MEPSILACLRAYFFVNVNVG